MIPTRTVPVAPASADEVHAYVRAAAAVLQLPLDDAQVQAVAGHLARTAAMAQLIEDAPLTPEDEPAEVYRPAPFPEADPPEDTA